MRLRPSRPISGQPLSCGVLVATADGDARSDPTMGQQQLAAVRLPLAETRKAERGHDRSDWANRIVVVAFKENDGGFLRALR
jgi:hypothetical protein